MKTTFTPPPVRWMRYQGTMHGLEVDKECARVRASELYRHGDMILVWVNEGDIVMNPNLDPKPANQ